MLAIRVVMTFNSFEDLEAWRLARSLKIEIRELIKNFPFDEKYRLTDQLTRSSRSVGANIAEGFGRFHYRDNLKFYLKKQADSKSS